MKRLLLLRHAKSSWDDPGLADFDRPLNARGRRAADLMGRHVAAAGLLPDRIVCSSAQRTRATLAGLLPAMPHDMEIRLRRAIYEARPEAILATVRADGGDADTLMVIGHNPGLQETALALLPGEETPGRRAIAAHFPTAALAVLAFDLADWSAIAPHAGRLETFVRPKDLEAASDAS